MSGIEKAALPPIPSGVVTGDLLRSVLSTLLREVLADGDIRNASGTGGISISGGPGQTATLSISTGDNGDITVTGSGATWTIKADAVTFAKMQNVATDTVLGRATAGTGDVEALTCTAAGRALLDDADATAQLGTLGLQAAAVVRIYRGTGSPEGVLSADVGSMYQRSDGGAGTSLYVKESGSGNTGWVGK